MSQHIQLGLLGNGLSKSRARFLHELLGKEHGLDLSYTNMDLAASPQPVSIAMELKRCQQEGFRGVNVTHPYKIDAFNCVERVATFPKGLTSVNTVVFEADRMIADNTDYSGFCAAFRACFGNSSEPGRVLMFGAGGVGLAIAYGLKAMGVHELVVYDTNLQTAEKLVNQLNDHTVIARLANQDLVVEMQQADGLINATPVGMFQYPGNPFPIAGFASQSWAFDAVYTPENTEFLQNCRQREIATLSGFQLFLYQGLHAFERFTGITPDAAKTEKMFLDLYPLE